MKWWIVLLMMTLLGPVPCSAAGSPDGAREIERLIAALGDSDCEFQRNGRWHDAVDAEQHLRRKYEWLRKRDLAGSPEQFIERAGTRSSITGRVYQVRCPGEPVVQASDWLRTRLQALRRRAGNAS